MNLDFDTLIIQDFKSWRGRHVFDLLKYGEGLHYMRGRNQSGKRMGSNGSGKSTLWDAIVWCLFGETVKGLKNPGVKPWGVKKPKTIVTLDIVKDKERYTVERSIGPNRLTINGKDVGYDKIVQLIGMTKDMVLHAVIMGQGRPLFFDLPPKDKMDLFVDALALDRWDSRATNATDDVRKLEKELIGYDAERLQLDERNKSLVEMRAKVQADYDHWSTEWQATNKRKAKELKAAEAKLEAIAVKRDQSDLKLEGAEIELRQLLKDFDAHLITLQDARSEFAKAERMHQADLAHCAALQRDLKAIGKGDACPSCGQSLKGTALERHRADLRKQLRKLEDFVLEGIPPAFAKGVDRAEAKKVKLRDDLIAFRKKSDNAKDDLDVYDRQYAELKGTVTALREAILGNDTALNPHGTALRHIKGEMSRVANDIDACQHDIASVKKDIERTGYWTKGFKDIRLFVLEDVMAELDLATNAMLDEAGLIGWNVKYELERETARGTIKHALNIMVSSPDSEGFVNWESWSGGEAQRLRVVGALALSEVLLNHAGVTTSIEVLDEPTQHLSTEGVADLCEYLSDRAERLHRQIWYVDHTAIESQRFASVTTIKRDRDGSYLANAAFSVTHA